MQHYRAYTVGKDGNVIRFRTFLCSNDEDAIVWTKQLLDGFPIELWNDKRFILRVDSPPIAPR
jgi:hypothetical protein